MDTTQPNPNLIPSPGTRIVTRAATHPLGGGDICPKGIVGVILTSPADNQHAYRVRYVNGVEAQIRRPEFEILSDHQKAGFIQPRGAIDEYDLGEHVIYRCIVGSRAYGLDHDNSDTDLRGIYLPPSDMHWSLYGVPEQLENQDTEECYWELQKFIVLALKANPNILECLYTPLVEHATPLAQELLDMRHIFLSKLVYQTYNGYVLSQFQRMNRRLRNQGKIKPKHAMHLIRLMLSGITVLTEGTVAVRVQEHRDQLLDIRDGRMEWDKVEQWRKQLHVEFENAYENTKLPDRPDYQKANEYLVRARRFMADQEQE